jgi:hypothetical protein
MGLTDEQQKTLERLRRHADEPKAPFTSPNEEKFTDDVLVPASEHRDWHEIADRAQRPLPEEKRRKKPLEK